MHAESLTALQSSLRGIAPQGGIAYLLCCVDPDYWVPVVTSNETLEKTPYYRLGYAFDLAGVADREPKQIGNDITELVTRGKIEALVFEALFYQEVIPVGVSDSVALAIVRSSPDKFLRINPDVIKAVNPLIPFIHKTWGELSFDSHKENQLGDESLTPASIAQSAAELFSDIPRFPPYFLLTDYVLSVYANKGNQERNICSNPLGYTRWIRKNLARTPLPWVQVMADRSQSYDEDLRKPKAVSQQQAEEYKKALLNSDLLANLLADKLRDDVKLVAYVPVDNGETARIKLWARHNRPQEAAVINFSNPEKCATPIIALRQLLHEAHQEGDFLITLWATQLDEHTNSWSAIHVGCDTSHRLRSFSEDAHVTTWPKIALPIGCDNDTYPRIEVRFRPFEHESIEDTKTSVERVGRVLVHFYEQTRVLNHEAAIRSFWSKVVASKEKYSKQIFKTGELGFGLGLGEKGDLDPFVRGDPFGLVVFRDESGVGAGAGRSHADPDAGGAQAGDGLHGEFVGFVGVHG